MKRRRDFIAGLGSAAAWPVVGRAQQTAVPIVGFVNSSASDKTAPMSLPAFRQGLARFGYVEGQSVRIEYRWADGQYERLPGLVADLMNHQVAVIVAGGPPAALVAKAATSTVPIVFTSGADAVKLGLVASLSRPGGNVTGISFLIQDLATKRMSLLRDLVPNLHSIAVLVNPSYLVEQQAKDAEDAARSFGLQSHVTNAGTEREIDAAFVRMAELRVDALFINSDPFLSNQRARIVALTARYALPASDNFREFAEVGGLMSYGASIADAYGQAGTYVGRILRGEKPADLPVMQPNTFELVINRKTAMSLGLTIPPRILALADEVIE